MSENVAKSTDVKETADMTLDVNKKLPLRTKIGYSFGEIGL